MKSLQLPILAVLLFLSSIMNSCKDSLKEYPENLEGHWQQVGYGHQVSIDSSDFIAYDITSISCLPVLESKVSDFGDLLGVRRDTLWLKDGINTYYFTRIDDLDSTCRQDLSEEVRNDPEYNFEILAETFKDHYAYFELRKVNWDELYKAFRPKITSETTAPELYATMQQMLDSFNDGHIGLDAPDSVEIAASLLRPKQSVESDQTAPEIIYSNHQVAQAIADHYLKDKKSRRNKMFQWGMLDDDFGYMQINQMMGFADYVPDSLTGRDYWMAYFEKGEQVTTEAHTQAELEGISNIMDEVMKDFENTKAIIIDLRFNGGGKDEVGLEVMRRFNKKDHLVFTKKARMGNAFTKPIEVSLKSSANAFTKPVYLLTSHESASATEIMILSSLLLDHVTRIGSNTEGVFSDVLDKVLANGWEFGLSNEVYLDTHGLNYEGQGIPAQIELAYPSDKQEFLSRVVQALENEGDTAILKARSLISQ